MDTTTTNSTIAIVQARLGSTRLPEKVLRQIGDISVIGLLLERLSLSKLVDNIVVAIPDDESNNKLANHIKRLEHNLHLGSEKDVLDRFYSAAIKFNPQTIVRITGDCPLIDPGIVDAAIALFESSGADYTSNTTPPTFPDGLDVEVFSFGMLESAWCNARSEYEREHVTPYIRNSHKLHKNTLEHSSDYSSERWTVDEIADIAVVTNIVEYFSPRRDFSWFEVLDLKRANPTLFSSNRHISRNEGVSMQTGQKLWRRAKHVIPGGNLLLSKRPEFFLPERWPTYFSRAKGCQVWDLDGTEYTDLSLMGVGTNTLGYGHEVVDEAVREVITKGNMSTLNCPEEVELAERLLDIHPWADMVRFARTGGEANSISVRIARAASGREKVAFCGYHGWHDWYLAANIGDGRSLDGHLLPGLNPLGVPSNLRDTIFPFEYNRFDQLEELVRNHNIGVISMEVMRNEPPSDGFLEQVRALATKHNIVLIFDECTSGFRQNFGGLHKTFEVEPDIAVFGKALGNGYAITSVIGRREVMEIAQNTFISSTFWTERIGPVAGLASLAEMEEIGSWEIITEAGLKIRQGWIDTAQSHSLNIDVTGLPAVQTFQFLGPKPLEYKTILTQEMLIRGYLASNTIFTCIDHTSEVIDRYVNALNEVFGLIKQYDDGRDVSTILKTPVCETGFRRLN